MELGNRFLFFLFFFFFLLLTHGFKQVFFFKNSQDKLDLSEEHDEDESQSCKHKTWYVSPNLSHVTFHPRITQYTKAAASPFHRVHPQGELSRSDPQDQTGHTIPIKKTCKTVKKRDLWKQRGQVLIPWHVLWASVKFSGRREMFDSPQRGSPRQTGLNPLQA